MSGTLLIAEFRDPNTLAAAARRAREAGLRNLDAHTPFAVPGLPEALGLPPSRLRLVMLLVGLGAAAVTYALCWYGAVVSYPLNSGGRPSHSWQTFLVLSFEAAILAAALTGFVGFFVANRLPRLHDQVFGIPGFERASQDRFFLSVADPAADERRLSDLLDGLGLVSVQAVQP